jgi:hypothetical protein
MSESYHSEVDYSPLCTEDESAQYRSIIGCCIRIIDLSRFYIEYATSSMSSFDILSRKGHLKVVKRILFYLKTSLIGSIIVDTSYPDHFVYFVDKHLNWMEFHPNEILEKKFQRIFHQKNSKSHDDVLCRC